MKTKKRITNASIGIAYGAASYGTFLGSKWVLSKLGEEFYAGGKSLDNVIDSLKESIITEGTLSEEQMSQLYYNLANLKSRPTNRNLSSIQAIENQQQIPTRSVLIDARDQLKDIKRNREEGLTYSGLFSLIIGGSLILAFGYNSLKRIYKSITPSH
jgi:hypothetical protein